MTPGIGVHPCVTDRSMPLLDLARATEARGLAAIYLPEHTHIPVATEGYPGGGPMPERYARVLDPFIAGAWIAASTKLEIGTAVALPAEHDAIANTALFTAAIEQYVRRYPEQWLWVHRRWKARPPGEPPLY